MCKTTTATCHIYGGVIFPWFPATATFPFANNCETRDRHKAPPLYPHTLGVILERSRQLNWPPTSSNTYHSPSQCRPQALTWQHPPKKITVHHHITCFICAVIHKGRNRSDSHSYQCRLQCS